MHIGLLATIRYFVKVTVNVPSFFKENPRAVRNNMINCLD
jgi:hypothetical protein